MPKYDVVFVKASEPTRWRGSTGVETYCSHNHYSIQCFSAQASSLLRSQRRIDACIFLPDACCCSPLSTTESVLWPTEYTTTSTFSQTNCDTGNELVPFNRKRCIPSRVLVLVHSLLVAALLTTELSATEQHQHQVQTQE